MLSLMVRRIEEKWLWIVVVGAILTQTGVGLLRPVTSYKLLTLGAGEAAVGLTTAVYAVIPLFLAMWLGRLSGRISAIKNILIIGALTLAIGGAGLAWGSTVTSLVVSSAILGMGQLVFTIGGQTVISRRAKAGQMDAGFGWFTAAYSIGQMVGPLLSGMVLGDATIENMTVTTVLESGINAALWLAAGACMLAVPVLYFMNTGVPPSLGRSSRPLQSQELLDANSKPTILRIMSRRGIPSQLFASLSIVTMVDILTAFMPLVGEAAGVSPWWVGVLLAVRGGASFLARIALPWLSRRWPRNQLILVSMLVASVALAFVPPALDAWNRLEVAAVLVGVGGFLLGIGPPLTMSMLTQSVPAGWRGPALAVRLMGNRSGQVVLPLLAGLIASPLGPAAGIWCACSVLALSGAERCVSAYRTKK